MKYTKETCPSCGGNSMVQHDDGSFECFGCHHVSYPAYSEDARAFDEWVNRVPGRLKEPEPEHPALTTVIRNFRSICGVSPVVEVVVEEYRNGGAALQLWDHEGPLMTATVWLPGIPAGDVAIKDRDENAGCLAQLIAHGIVGHPYTELQGYPVCRLLLATSTTQNRKRSA